MSHLMIELWHDGKRYSRHWAHTSVKLVDLIETQELLSAAYHKRQPRDLDEFVIKPTSEGEIIIQVKWRG